jgi:hypothetical protein
VIGQKDFTSSSVGLSQSGLSGPNYAVIDSSGNLWVGDYLNSRVLEFKPPFSIGMDASLVIGQPNFGANTEVTSQSGKYYQGGLAFDSSGNLWVGDHANNRVLEFKPPFSTGMTASLVIGQKNFTTARPSTTKDGLARPTAVAFDHSDNLWVYDGRSFRVLEFKPPFSNGMGASLVIGQQDFNSSLFATTQNGFQDPGHLAFDSSGNLWVPDFENNRILEFSSTPVPEFPTASLAIVAVVSLAVVAIVSRRFSPVRLANHWKGSSNTFSLSV